MDANSFPIEITIKTPVKTKRKRGIHATSTMQDFIKVRVSKKEFDTITKICETLNMDRAAFLRWCATETARVMMENCYDNQQSSSAG